jgi:hypothetical protein
MKIFTAFSFLLLFSFLTVQAQVTYTSNGTCTSLTTGSCWTKTGDCNSSSTPPLSGTSACPVNIVINHTINVPLDLNLGSHVNLTVNATGTLNVGGNINIASKAVNTSINVNGGAVNVTGAMNIEGGADLTVNLINSGKFIVSGALNVGNDVIFTITGNNTSTLQANVLNIGQRSKINILSGGRLFVEKDVDYKGNNSELNVSGFFRTAGSVLITGGAGNELNALGNGIVIIGGNLEVRGTSEITFGGTSQVDIGGEIKVGGNAKVIATDKSVVYVCGAYSGVTNSGEGQIFAECRLLPVEYSSLELMYMSTSRSVKLSWATAKEWENSHFEIQRAVGKNLDFQTVGEVAGIGWSDMEVSYVFEDNSLPLYESQVFYRLKQVNFDGSYAISKVLAAKVPGMPEVAETWRAYPNPSNGQRVQVGLLNPLDYQSGKVAFRLNSALVSTGLVQVQDHLELNEKLGMLTDTLQNGLYVLEIQWGQQVQKIKLIIRK